MIRERMIVMFREDNNVYYRPDCNNTNHADTIVRQPKKKALLESKMQDLQIAQYKLRKVDPANYSKIQTLTHEIHKLEHEIENMQNIDIPHKSLHKCKKMKPDKIFAYCVRVLNDSKKHNIYFITAEDIAYQLNTHVHLVKQCFAKMNQMGLLSQPKHSKPHDCYRPKCTEWDNIDSSWAGDVYYIQ